jgi:putative FmdB family regulatory protein
MPTYSYECTVCGQIQEQYRKLSEFTEEQDLVCHSCLDETPHRLVVLPPAVHDWGQGRFFEHLGPVGRTFYDKKSYERHLKANGLVEWSPKKGMPGQVV